MSAVKGFPTCGRQCSKRLARVTAVDPLPKSFLERIYSEPDELDGVTAEELSKFQSQAEPE